MINMEALRKNVFFEVFFYILEGNIGMFFYVFDCTRHLFLCYNRTHIQAVQEINVSNNRNRRSFIQAYIGRNLIADFRKC